VAGEQPGRVAAPATAHPADVDADWGGPRAAGAGPGHPAGPPCNPRPVPRSAGHWLARLQSSTHW